MSAPSFSKLIEMLRSTDGQLYEDGYQWLLGKVDDHLDELIEIMLEEKDPLMREKLVELIGCSSEMRAIPVLEEELRSPFVGVRNWAYSSLCHHESADANRIASKFKRENPNEEFL